MINVSSVATATHYMIFGADRSLVLVLRNLIVANTFVLKLKFLYVLKINRHVYDIKIDDLIISFRSRCFELEDQDSTSYAKIKYILNTFKLHFNLFKNHDDLKKV